jgi:hypothetical protein
MKITKRDVLIFILGLITGLFIFYIAPDFIQGFKEGYNAKI